MLRYENHFSGFTTRSEMRSPLVKLCLFDHTSRQTIQDSFKDEYNHDI